MQEMVESQLAMARALARQGNDNQAQHKLYEAAQVRVGWGRLCSHVESS